MPRKRKFAICPKCGEFRKMTEHHKIPRRIRENDDVFLLCRECHDGVETAIHLAERELLRRHEGLYLDVLQGFLMEV